MKRLLLLVLLVGCAESSADLQKAKVGSLEYSMLLDWHQHTVSSKTGTIVEWSPDDNARKETVVVMMTRPLGELGGHGLGAAAQLLDQAVGGLHGARFTRLTHFTSVTGMRGLRTEGTFIPASGTTPYRRVHAVFEQGDTLVHVIYTAQAGDPNLVGFTAVIDSLRQEGA